MLRLRRFVLPAIACALYCHAASAQISFQQIAKFGNPSERAGRFSGGREVEFTQDASKLIAAFYGCSAQLFDLKENAPVAKPIGTSGDGQVGFVNDDIAYTADWNAVRLWDTSSGEQIGETIPHKLREDTIIHPAVSPQGKYLATRSTMKSVQLWDVATRKAIGNQRDYPSVVYSIRFSDNGKLLFVRSGGSLHVIDPETADSVAGPFKSGWQFYYDTSQQRLLTTQQVEKGAYQLVVRATDRENWPETHRSDLPGRLQRIVPLNDNQLLLQATKNDYTPDIFTISLAKPEPRNQIQSTADRAFRVVVPENKRLWICNNIRNISCQEFGKSEPLWQKEVPPSGYDQAVYPMDNEHFIIRDKQENFGVYKIADGSLVWKQTGVKRFSVSGQQIAICKRSGIEIWALQ